jgi:ATP-dependent Lon protease
MFNISRLKKTMNMTEQKPSLPLLPLRDVVVFPHMVVPLFVGRAKSVNSLSNAMNLDKKILLVTQKNAGVDSPSEQDIYGVGTVGAVLQLLKLPDGTVKALVEGKGRAHITRFIDKERFIVGEI